MKPHARDQAGFRQYGRYKKRHGFTLIEMMTVMVVIGIVIAAAFLTASAVHYRNQLNQAIDEIGAIVVNMRALYAGQNASAVAYKDFPTATPTLIQQLVFPAEMLVPSLPASGIPAAGTVANNLMDQGLGGGTALVALCPVGSACAVGGFNVAQFAVRYVNLTPETCTDLIVRNSTPGPDTGLLQIKVNGAVVGTANNGATPLPIDAVSAASACFRGGTYTVDWFYTLGS